MPPKKVVKPKAKAGAKPKAKAGAKVKKVAVIYTLQFCPWCDRVKKHLRAKGFTVKEHKIKRGDAAKKLPDGRMRYTYPQVFLLSGGYEETVAFLK